MDESSQNLIKPQQHKSREPSVVGRVGRHLGRLPLANVARQGKTSAQASRCEQVQDGDDDLYNASPPARKRQRSPLKPSPEPVQLPPSNSMATETRRRKSSRRRVKPSLGANMLLWEDIDDEELDPDD
jgi:hypothetical protein